MMDHIDQWLVAAEPLFFTRVGEDLMEDFSECGLDRDVFSDWYQYRVPGDAIEEAHRRQFLETMNEVVELLLERVRAISVDRAEAEQAVCRRELAACMRRLEQCIPRLEAEGLVENWAAWNTKLVRVAANIVVFARLEERVGIPDGERIFRWLGWIIERGHVICGVRRKRDQGLCWMVW
jgi:hypothetical protein